MPYSFDADQAKGKSFDDDVVQDEINYIMNRVIEEAEANKRKAVINGNTVMTGKNARADFSAITEAKSISSIVPSANYVFAVNSTGHGLSSGDHVMMMGITDSTLEPLINDSIFRANVTNDNAFEIYRRHSISSSNAAKSLVGGELNVLADGGGASAVVTIYLNDHGYSAGDEIDIQGIATADLSGPNAGAINGGRYTILPGVSSNSFDFGLSGKSDLRNTRLESDLGSTVNIESRIDGDGYTAVVIFSGSGLNNHGFKAGDSITISGLADSIKNHAAINGSRTIARASTNDFSINISGSDLEAASQAATGGRILQRGTGSRVGSARFWDRRDHSSRSPSHPMTTRTPRDTTRHGRANSTTTPPARWRRTT